MVPPFSGLFFSFGRVYAAAGVCSVTVRTSDGDATAAGVNQLKALLNEVDALEQSGRLTGAQAAPLRDLVARLLASLMR